MKTRGGKRSGAGRKPSKLVEAREVLAGSQAGKILASVDEKKIWRGLIASRDPRLRFDVMRYLTDRRDGKPVQREERTGAEGNAIQTEITVRFV